MRPVADRLSLITLNEISKSWDGGLSYALKDITFSVSEGEVLALLGGSGSGKSTLVKIVNRLIEPTDGEVRLEGVNTSDLDPVLLRRRIGYVFQGIGLFPHLTVGENISIVWRASGSGPTHKQRKVDELLDLVQLRPDLFRDRYPSEMSGGQRQRVGFARALATDCRVMLLDEPFGALDPVTRDDLQREFTRIQRELNLTVVLVTHDISEALLLAGRVAVLNQGKLLRVGTAAELIHAPEDSYVTRLIDTPLRQARQFEAILNRVDKT